jgi:hypothetical protein
MQALAEHLMESELGIKSRRTIWREHLYELDGFRRLLGEPILAKLKAKQPVPVAELPGFPIIGIRLRGSEALNAFTDLKPTVLSTDDGRIILDCQSVDGLAAALLGLNIHAERLEFDPIRGVEVLDDGSTKSIEYAIDCLAITKGLLCNAQLEVWDCGSGAVLGFTDPCIPENIDLPASLANIEAQVHAATAMASERRRSEQTQSPATAAAGPTADASAGS